MMQDAEGLMQKSGKTDYAVQQDAQQSQAEAQARLRAAQEQARLKASAEQTGEAAKLLNRITANMDNGKNSGWNPTDKSMMSGDDFKTLISGTYNTIQDKLDKVQVQNSLSSKESSSLGISGGPLLANGADMDKVRDRFNDLQQKANSGEATEEEQKEMGELAKLIDNAGKQTAKLDAELGNVNATFNLLAVSADKAMENYQAQRGELEAAAKSMYLSGNVDMKQLMALGDAANTANRKALAIQSEQALANSVTKDDALKKAKQEAKDANDKLAANPTDVGLQDLAARANYTVSSSATDAAAAAQIAKLETQAYQQSQNQYDIMKLEMSPREMLIDASKNQLALDENQLQLSMQYGNSAAKNVQIIKKALSDNDTIVDQLQEQLKFLNDQLATNSKLSKDDRVQMAQDVIDKEKQINEAKAHQLEIMQQIGEINKANIEYATAEADQYEAMVGLADSMGMGVQASAAARMDAVNAIGQEIKGYQVEVDALKNSISEGVDAKAAKAMAADPSLKLVDAQKEANDELIRSRTNLAQKETTILGLMQKQANITKSIRDGWLSAIQASTTGTGIFAKFMFNQEKGLGVLLGQVKGVPQAMGTGGVSTTRSVGQRSFAQFGVGGQITGRYDPSARPDYFNGGPELNQQIMGNRQAMMGELQRLNDEKKSAGALGFAGASGSGAAGAFVKDITSQPGVKVIGAAMEEALNPELLVLKDILEAVKGLRMGGVPRAAQGMAPSRMTPSGYPVSGDHHPVLVNSNEMILNPAQHKNIAKALGTTSAGLLNYRGMPKAADGMAPMSFDEWQNSDQHKANMASTVLKKADDGPDTIAQWKAKKAADNSSGAYYGYGMSRASHPKGEITAQELGISQAEKDNNDALNRGVRDTFVTAKKNGLSSKDANAAAHNYLMDQKAAQAQLQAANDLDNARMKHDFDLAGATLKPLDKVYDTGDWTPEQLRARQLVNWEMEEAKKTGEKKDLDAANARKVQADADAIELRKTQSMSKVAAQSAEEQAKRDHQMDVIRAANAAERVKWEMDWKLAHPDKKPITIADIHAREARAKDAKIVKDFGEVSDGETLGRHIADSEISKNLAISTDKKKIDELMSDVGMKVKAYTDYDLHNGQISNVHLGSAADMDDDLKRENEQLLNMYQSVSADAVPDAKTYTDASAGLQKQAEEVYKKTKGNKATKIQASQAFLRESGVLDVVPDPRHAGNLLVKTKILARMEADNIKHGSYAENSTGKQLDDEYGVKHTSILGALVDKAGVYDAADWVHNKIHGEAPTDIKGNESLYYKVLANKQRAEIRRALAGSNETGLGGGAMVNAYLSSLEGAEGEERGKLSTQEALSIGGVHGLTLNLGASDIYKFAEEHSDKQLLHSADEAGLTIATLPLQELGGEAFSALGGGKLIGMGAKVLGDIGEKTGINLLGKGLGRLYAGAGGKAIAGLAKDKIGSMATGFAGKTGLKTLGELGQSGLDRIGMGEVAHKPLGDLMKQGGRAVNNALDTGAAARNFATDLANAQSPYERQAIKQIYKDTGRVLDPDRIPANRSMSGFGSDIPAPKGEMKLPENARHATPDENFDWNWGPFAKMGRRMGFGPAKTPFESMLDVWGGNYPTTFNADPAMVNFASKTPAVKDFYNTVPKYHTGGMVNAPEGQEVQATLLGGERVQTISELRGTHQSRPVNMSDDMPERGQSISSSSPAQVNINITVDTSQLATIPSKVQAKIDELKRGLAGDGQLNSGKSFNTYGR